MGSRRTILAGLALAAVFAAPLALAAEGGPIVGIPIGLEGDPGSVRVSGVTDARGQALFGKLGPARYNVVLSDISILKGPIRISVGTPDGVMVTSEPIGPGRGRAYALDRSGQRLSVTVPDGVQGGGRAGGQLRVTLSIFDRWGRR